MPTVIFAAFAIVCQAATIAISLMVEKYLATWLGVVSFGVLYIVAFAVAWKLTIWVVEARGNRTSPQV